MDIIILKLFYNEYQTIPQISLKLNMNEDEIDNIISYYYNKYFINIPLQYIIIPDEYNKALFEQYGIKPIELN